jgi:hypothetical protein
MQLNKSKRFLRGEKELEALQSEQVKLEMELRRLDEQVSGS